MLSNLLIVPKIIMAAKEDGTQELLGIKYVIFFIIYLLEFMNYFHVISYDTKPKQNYILLVNSIICLRYLELI